MNDPFSTNWNAPNAPVNAPNQPKPPTADITVVLDRSSSMASMKEGVIEGFNKYVHEMRKTPGDSVWSMAQFDDYSSAKGAGESFPQWTYKCRKETEVPFLTSGNYLPRGGTALVDAVCMAVQETEARVSGSPTQPIMVIITDGEENSSREFSTNKMREMVARTQANGFQYIYLGANQDSFAEAGKYGFANSGSMSPSWLNAMQGGALVAGASPVYNFASTSQGISMAIGSGLTATCALVSGALCSGQIVHPPMWTCYS